MREHKTTNPKYIKLQEDYTRVRENLLVKNPYLTELLDKAKMPAPIGARRFGYNEAIQVIELFDETGYTDLLHCDADMQDPDIFWNLMDCAKARQIKTGSNRAIRGINFFYEKIEKEGILKEEFKNGDKSPYLFLRKNSFLKIMCEEYTQKNDVFIIKYHNVNLPMVLILPYKNTNLRRIVIEAYKRDVSIWSANHKSTREMCNMEEVFGPYSDSINNIEDLNATILTHAKDYIMTKYAKDEQVRIRCMKHLWNIFRYAVQTYPEKKFFEGSHLWNATLILSHNVPTKIAKGYIPVIVESQGSIEAHEKVLFVYTNGQYMGANGVSYGMFCMDFSDIKNDLYRWLAINYTATVDQRVHATIVKFLLWLTNRKQKPTYKHNRNEWIYADELMEYKFEIAKRTRCGGSRNAFMATLVHFLRWAAGTKKIHLQKGVFKYFDGFKHRYIPKPKSLTTIKIKAIEKALIELSERDKRYLLTLNIVKILLRSDIRAGQLCSIDLERMIWNEDGTSGYISLVKNRGRGMVMTDFSKVTTKLIRDAIEQTDDIRNDCPIEGPKTALYLYRGCRRCDDPISVMNLQRINEDLSDACEKAGIPKITTGNIRDTRNTAVMKFAHKHNLNDAQITTLTRHAKKTSVNSYTDIHIEDLMYAAEDIKLGTIIYE